MLVEPIRILADWFKHPTYGVNAMLPLVKRDYPDPVPPDIQLIADETRDEAVANGHEPKRHPALYVMQDLPYELLELLQTSNQPRDGDVVIAIRYIVTGSRHAQRIAEAAYTLRAVLASVTRLFSTPAGATARQRNDVQIYSLMHAAIARVDEEVGQSRSAGAAIITLRVRESATSV